jgi:hypothetical protein
MFDKILHMLEGKKKPSYQDRLQSIDEFFKKYDLYKEMWPEQSKEPLSIVWAISTNYPEIFMQQLGSLLQFDNILGPDDEIIFVADVERRADAAAAKFMTQSMNTKGVIVRRPYPGDGPALNWDVGVDYVKNDRVMFTRDLGLFFNPWELISKAKTFSIAQTLCNFSTVLGPVWSRFSDKWLYLVHPRFAPNPFLFTFVLSKKDYDSMNGFDTMLSRGYDHTGELDFLLRWNMKGYTYFMSEDVQVFHPGIAANSREELDEMQFQSSINRRYFFDRYGEQFISSLKPPYKSDVNMVEVSHALTLDPLSEVVLDEEAFNQFDEIKDAFTFNKWYHKNLVQEVL